MIALPSTECVPGIRDVVRADRERVGMPAMPGQPVNPAARHAVQRGPHVSWRCRAQAIDPGAKLRGQRYLMQRPACQLVDSGMELPGWSYSAA